MKSVLFIHYHFLPVHNVAVKRLVGYARHLPALGWRPLVLTREWRSTAEADPSWGLSWESGLERDLALSIERVPHRPPPAATRQPLLDRASNRLPPKIGTLATKGVRFRRILFGEYPDEFVSWVPPAVAAGVALAHRERIDAILSYCPPETNHLVARRLARRLGVPWVAFFGDMYGFLEPPRPRTRELRNQVEHFLRVRWHRRCLAPAAACVGVSPAMVDYLARAYRKPSRLVLTGFEREAPGLVPDERSIPRDRLVVSHVGSLYPGDQRPEILLDGVDLLLTRRPDAARQLEIRFVGSKCDDHLRAMLVGRPAQEVCTIWPKVDATTAVSLVHSSDVLLAFTCSAHRDRFGTMSYPTKIFEAVGAGRPVLSIPADEDWVDDLLARTGGGSTASDASEVAERLASWLDVWRHDGRVPFDGDTEELAALTVERQTERLARLLDSIAPGCPASGIVLRSGGSGG